MRNIVVFQENSKRLERLQIILEHVDVHNQRIIDRSLALLNIFLTNKTVKS